MFFASRVGSPSRVQVVEHTKEGLKQLDKAEQHQKSARPFKCICLLLFLIAIMLTALILKHPPESGGGGGGGDGGGDTHRVRHRQDDDRGSRRPNGH